MQEKKNSEVSKYSILPYIQNRKLGNLIKCSFTSNFDSCCNLKFRNDINELRQKLKGKARYAFRRKKYLRFPSFPFCPTLKIENWEISEIVALLQILLVVVT